MAEYIDRDDVIKVILKWEDKPCFSFLAVARDVMNLPSADVVERKRGKWSGIPQLKTAKCPLCGKETDILIYNDGVLEGCRYCGVRPPIQTNADKLRSMSDEELAKWISGRKETCPPIKDYKCSAMSCYECWLAWMRKEAEDG